MLGWVAALSALYMFLSRPSLSDFIPATGMVRPMDLTAPAGPWHDGLCGGGVERGQRGVFAPYPSDGRKELVERPVSRKDCWLRIGCVRSRRALASVGPPQPLRRGRRPAQFVRANSPAWLVSPLFPGQALANNLRRRVLA